LHEKYKHLILKGFYKNSFREIFNKVNHLCVLMQLPWHRIIYSQHSSDYAGRRSAALIGPTDNAAMDGDGMTAVFVEGKVRRAAAEKARALMTDYGRHYYYPLGRLMQLLPGDITNAPRLTPEQGRMCQAVSHFAGQAAFVIWSGLKAINDLQFIASKAAPLEPRPDTSAFVAYLEAESAFMHANKNDYRDAARNVATAT
jgi:hypothetical protein